MKKTKFILLPLIFSVFLSVSCSNSSDDSTGNQNNNSEFGIKYSFYINNTTDQAWAVINGKEGSILPTVSRPEKAGYRFTCWKTKEGNEPPAVFGNQNLKFYAQWADGTKIIGSKPAPDTVGDVIFTDGSASPYPENLDDLTEAQWKAAIAMLFTTTYNPSNGKNEAGGQYQYKLAAGLVVSESKKWCTDIISKDDSKPCKYESTRYNSMYIGYSWNSNSFKTNSPFSPISSSTYFGKQNLVDSNIFKTTATVKTAPAFEYAIQYGKTQQLSSDYRDNWYLPSSYELHVLLLTKDIRAKYNRLITKKYTVLNSKTGIISTLTNNTEFWSSSTGNQDADIKTYVSEKNDGYYGVKESKDIKKYLQIWMFDPYTGEQGKPLIPVNAESGYFGHDKAGYTIKKRYLYTKPDCSEKEPESDSADPILGYVYQYVFYLQAYKITASGIEFDKKTNSHAVIPVRVF